MRRRVKKEEPMAMRDWPEPAWTPALGFLSTTTTTQAPKTLPPLTIAGSAKGRKSKLNKMRWANKAFFRLYIFQFFQHFSSLPNGNVGKKRTL